jgi:quercetin dioxygenase-like cupin family protein
MGIVHKRTEGDAGNDSMWRWDGVDVYAYNSNNATKQVIIGAEDGAKNFIVRYFSIPPHGFSSLDQHSHEHGVVVVQGRARVMLGERFEEVGPGDAIFIPGWERHQFENLTDGIFTFLCIVPPKPAQPAADAQPERAATEA